MARAVISTTSSLPRAYLAKLARDASFGRASRLFGAASMAVFLSARFFLSPWFNSNRGGSLDAALSGEASRPYAYRVLVPAVCRLLEPPARALLRGAADTGAARAFARFTAAAHLRPDHAPAVLVLVVLAFCSFVATPLILDRLIERLDLARGEKVTAITTAAMAAVPLLLLQGDHFFYDPATLLFGALLTYLAAFGAPSAFTLVSWLAFANKETAVLFAFVALFVRSDRTLATRLRWLLVQLAGYAAIAQALRLALHLPPPSALDNSVRDYLTSNLMGAATGAPWDDYAHFAALLVFFRLVMSDIHRRPRVLQLVLALVVPLGIGYLRGGCWGEVRVFYDVAPVVGVLGALNVLRDVELASLTWGPVRLSGLGALTVLTQIYALVLALSLLARI